MATNTYVPLDKVTLGSAAASATFTSISQGYTDLIIVANLASSTSARVKLRVGNGSIDTGSNYSYTIMSSSGSANQSGREPSLTEINYYWYGIPSGWSNYVFNVQNYSNTSTFKTILTRGDSPAVETFAHVGLWRSTNAINTIEIRSSTGTFDAGSTFSLYGIRPWSADTTPKATGGIVTSDATYWYHTFPFSGAFVPNQTLTCDYLIVGGGGGGGCAYAAGGGAGGYRSFTSQSISAATYPIVVGAGGGGGYYGGYSGTLKVAPTSGTDSTFNSYSSAGGGFGGYVADGAFYGNAGSGGSGGGGSRDRSAGSGNTPSTSPSQGNSGGTGYLAPYYNGGGGGGAGGVGGNSGANGGNGGPGLNWLSLGTYYAGGGAGGAGDSGGFGTGGIGGGGDGDYSQGKPGAYATGGGGGGAANGGAGGGGVVIIRYPKA